MTVLARYLIGDHEHCDRLFAEAENSVADGNWALAESGFGQFSAATLRHFRREESILFPAFENRTGMTSGPTSVMRSEHEQIRGILEAMASTLAERDSAAYLGHSETLLMLLRQHNIKEEQILYPMVDRALAGEAAVLLTRLQDETD
jgi:iron-sulfur cluster repair protein YtfE (RIC family)